MSYGWDEPTTPSGSVDVGYDLYAPSPASTQSPARPAAPVTPAPSVVRSAPVTAVAASEEADSGPVRQVDLPWSLLVCVLGMPVVFVILRLALTPLIGLYHLSALWLCVGAAVLALTGLLLTRMLGRDAPYLGILLAVLVAIAETLLLVAPVAILVAGVSIRLSRGRLGTA